MGPLLEPPLVVPLPAIEGAVVDVHIHLISHSAVARELLVDPFQESFQLFFKCGEIYLLTFAVIFMGCFFLRKKGRCWLIQESRNNSTQMLHVLQDLPNSLEAGQLSFTGLR